MSTNKCFKCKKSLSEPSGGVYYSGASLFASVSNSTYQCKSCSVAYCLDCMTELKKGNRLCFSCGNDMGW